MDDKIKEIATVISDKMIELGYGMSGIETDLARAAYEVMTRSDGDVTDAMIEAGELAEMEWQKLGGHRAVGSHVTAVYKAMRLAALTQSSVQPD